MYGGILCIISTVDVATAKMYESGGSGGDVDDVDNNVVVAVGGGGCLGSDRAVPSLLLGCCDVPVVVEVKVAASTAGAGPD